MASAASNVAIAATAGTISQISNSRNMSRQTRTNPSRTSKTVARSFHFYGQSSAGDSSQVPTTPHGLYPALTHFTDAITALPREFRRHNSLLKEVDAKAWALEDNLQQLLLSASESRPVPYPPNPAPIVDGVVREYGVSQNDLQNVESQESRERRLLFDRVRRSLSDLMMTADEKNHVLTNANDELDHQLFRLNTIFPYISGEVSEEARLGSLTHWAYTNRTTAKAATTGNERPRREAASATSHFVHALHESEGLSHRGDGRRENPRKQRRNHAELDSDDIRTVTNRKGGAAKARANAVYHADSAITAQAPKRRKVVEKPAPVQVGGTIMERSISAVTNNGRAVSKDSLNADAKKRPRATNAVSTAGRKRNNTITSNVGSPSAVSSPIVGTFNPPRTAPSPGPSSNNRPQSSRAQQPASQAASRQRPPSVSNRMNANNKPVDSKNSFPRESSIKEITPPVFPGDTVRQSDTEKETSDSKANLVTDKSERAEMNVVDDNNAAEPMAISASSSGHMKGRSSKTSTPVVSTFPESQTRGRSSRNNTESGSKRVHKKTGSVSTAYKPRAAVPEEEESSREGDDEEDESEPRYCFCHQVSFGEMVACDNDACPTEWFHLSCVGLTKPPGRNVKWYCTDCKENMKRGRTAAK
ncbi:hypothetical protein BGW36DRAFT_169716 [Talaromyces proteolyticus]|uniref:Chromatin modification-related protein n=1 Tax=Talaromyces proteolyticus TaxID=1131652 RepID=A0AAD4KRF3_9EURO|nr:uncharacterized protein BGW36DRAFT_169716 [Talaromyces proteolyticus]KAH8697586.1 hypothetical protein BGW36DRAFT_169716 [Talaromyces proteolyticus]